MQFFSFRHTNIEIGVIGAEVDMKYDYEYLGDSGKALDDIISGKGDFAKVNSGRLCLYLTFFFSTCIFFDICFSSFVDMMPLSFHSFLYFI